MTTKEKVIKESIILIKKRIAEIKKILNATPLLDLIDVRKEAQTLLEENKTIQQRTSNEFIVKIGKLAEKEKQCIKLAKELTGQKMNDLMDEQINLESELRDLNNQLYYIKQLKL